MKLLHHNSLRHTPLVKILCSRVIYTIIAVLKTKQTTCKKKGKLESFQKKKYIFIKWIAISTKQQQFNLS